MLYERQRPLSGQRYCYDYNRLLQKMLDQQQDEAKKKKEDSMETN
jgi:hypothetical protein